MGRWRRWRRGSGEAKKTSEHARKNVVVVVVVLWIKANHFDVFYRHNM